MRLPEHGAEPHVDERRRLGLKVGDGVRVAVEGHADRRVAQSFGDDLGMNAGQQALGRVGVPEAVEVDVGRELRPLAQPPPRGLEAVEVPRLAGRGAEDEVAVRYLSGSPVLSSVGPSEPSKES